MKKNSKAYDYGRCPVCGEKMREQLINQDFWIKGKLLVIEDVPAGVCPQCGERVVQAEVGRQIAVLLSRPAHRRKSKSISVPVISFVEDVA
jgi:YgiT-type zinc finger domain-containing protein